MKKILIVICAAIIIGTIFAIFVFKGIDKTIALAKNKNYGFVYQVGVFKKYENAQNEANKYPSAHIIQEDDYYRVYIAIAIDKTIINAYDNYFNDNNINYYKKLINIKAKCYNKINSYERLLKKDLNPDIYFNINKYLLQAYKEDCND